jgi:poly(3-hydroxyalkanoate) synthetase
MNDPSLPGGEDGHAWTVAYSREAGEHWRFTAEWLRVTSDVKSRPAALGETSLAIESKAEISARYVFKGGF